MFESKFKILSELQRNFVINIQKRLFEQNYSKSKPLLESTAKTNRDIKLIFSPECHLMVLKSHVNFQHPN